MGDRQAHIVIAGGGASGVLLACHLLRDGGDNIRITLIEKRDSVGLGTAYSTSHPRHLLNVRASNMSAFADDPQHFQRWLSNESALVERDQPAALVFAPRNLYGRYLRSLIDTFDRDRRRLTTVHDEVTEIMPEEEGVRVRTAAGETTKADVAVLATGFSEPQHDDQVIRSPWSQPVQRASGPCRREGRGEPVVVTLCERSHKATVAGPSGPATGDRGGGGVRTAGG